MATLGFGIVGCGMIARFHARAIADLRGCRLRAVYDTFGDAAQKLAQAEGPGVDAHDKLEEMLARPDIDVVNICTPSGAHLEPALLAARAKKHVVIEKPMEVTLKRCDAILKACAEARVQVCTIFPSRFSEANVELKKAIHAGRFGRLTLADCTVKWWREQRYYDSGGWRGTWKLDGGGALMNQAIHNVDLLLHMMGPVTQVSAFSSLLAHERIEVEDTAVACVRFANGALGVIEAATSTYPGLLKTLSVHGDKGSAIVEEDHLLQWSFAKEIARDADLRQRLGQGSGSTGGASDPSAISHAGHTKLLADFVKSLSSGKPALTGGDEGRRAVELILAIYQSQATGKIVPLPLAKDPKPPRMV